MRERLIAAVTITILASSLVEARLDRLEIDKREVLLDGKPFGLAGAYEKLVGTAHFALDPSAAANQQIVDLSLAPRNPAGEVEFHADFYLLKPVDPKRGNGILFYEAGNRGTKRILRTFQKATRSSDPTGAEEIGDGTLMRRGYSLLWLGWQWDVPEGRMRMAPPIATIDGAPIRGLVRGNFIAGPNATTARVADRGHQAYAPIAATAAERAEQRMTVRSHPLDAPELVPHEKWRFVDSQTVTLDGGFEAGRIYDVVYTSEAPRVVGCGLAATRDIVSFFKYDRTTDNPLPGVQHTIAWGVSQTGRFLRHFVYEGFNADEQGKQVFDGILDQVGGAGRGSFNHRFGQASRDALQHFNIHFPVDMFPFTDSEQTDPETGETDGLLRRATRQGTVPRMFHILTNSEYFNRGGSLVHTDPAGLRDATIPPTSRIYFIAGAPHIVGSFPPGPFSNPDFLGRAPMNPLRYDAVVRALFENMAAWLSNDREPPPSRYPRIEDGTLTKPLAAGWPAIPDFQMPREPLTPLRLDFGPRWSEGIVDFEPPAHGENFVVLVPAVDADGNDRAGIRLPEIAVPLATHTGWNYRDPSIGAPDRLSSEIGSYLSFPPTRTARLRSGDPRLAVEQRYRDKYDYLGRVTEVALKLVSERYLLAADIPEILATAETHYHWATR